jgi:Ca2+-binding RTX toxin-like protein
MRRHDWRLSGDKETFMTTSLRVTVRNTSEDGGTFLTPTYFGFHDGSFDLFNAGQAASAGLEQLAEDGSAAGLAAERIAADADSQGLVVTGAAGPIATGETTSAMIDVDGASNGFVSFAAMILPSNDAFIGSDDAIRLFSDSGRFLGAQTIALGGEDVYDAGTEVNSELDAAFINQTAPNTGVDEIGVVTQHPGFNGSVGNPVGDGDQIILGGTNAFGEAITEAADFTAPGASVATLHVNTVVERAGMEGRDLIIGRRDDDLVEAGAGRDIIISKGGWDVIDAGAGRDIVKAGRGDDLIGGGTGSDKLWGGTGNDAFIFAEGDGRDWIADFDRRGDDTLVLRVEGIDSFADVQAAAHQVWGGTVLSFGGGDSIFLRGVRAGDLEADDVVILPTDDLLA